MTDLFSMLPKSESVELLKVFDDIYHLRVQHATLHKQLCLALLAQEYAARREQQAWRKRDVSEYHAVMAGSQPRLRD